MALDDATSALLAQMAESGAPPMWELTPEQAREMGLTLKEMYGPGPDMQRVKELTVDSGAGGQFSMRILTPVEQPAAAIVYYHGGGWVLGNIDEFDTFGRTLAKATGAVVLLVNYRKAPEHPYPVPVEDSWSALQWADANLEAVAGRRVPIIVAGDSAGGNLAAIVALRARDRQGPSIDLQILAYPVTDSDLGTNSYVDPENQLMLARETMEWFWDHYIPRPGDRTGHEASPLRAESLANLPPAVVLTAEHDVLRDEGEQYARRLAEDGVEVNHRRFTGQMHGFFTFVNVLPGSNAGLDFVAHSIRDTIRKSPGR